MASATGVVTGLGIVGFVVGTASGRATGGSTTRSTPVAVRPFLSVMVMVTRSVFWNGANVCDEVTVNGLVPVITPVESGRTVAPVDRGGVERGIDPRVAVGECGDCPREDSCCR